MSTKNTLLYVNAILTFTEIKTLNEIKLSSAETIVFKQESNNDTKTP